MPGGERNGDHDREQRNGDLDASHDRLDERQREQRDAEGDQSRLDAAPPREVLAVDVEHEDADDQAHAERQDDDDKVRLREAQHLRREARAQHAKDADQRGGQREVGQRPEDAAVAEDEADAVGELIERGADGAAGLAAAPRWCSSRRCAGCAWAASSTAMRP